MIAATLYSDPACPWGYSASPALRVLEWRYRDQLPWRLVLIGLTRGAIAVRARGYTPERAALGQLRFRRYGMPFSPSPKARISATARGCRAVVAARILDPGSEWRVFRASSCELHHAAGARRRCAARATCSTRCPASSAGDRRRCSTAREVSEAYERDRAEARTAAGSATELQGKTRRLGRARCAIPRPSVLFERGRLRLQAGGFQPVEAYDVLVANLDPALSRDPVPPSPLPLLQYFPDGLTTQEVAALMAEGNDLPDRAGAEAGLIELVSSGDAVRSPLGDDALWSTA